MELPQPRRTQGDGKATHDFLSLYSSSSTQHSPTPSQGDYLKTHDFLQVGNNANMTQEEKKKAASPPATVEHLLPGGIGTYSISFFDQKVLKPCSTSRNDENSNSSSHTESGFTLWDESAVKKGKTGKEKIALQEAGVNVVGGQWASLMENPSQSSSYHKQNNISTFSSFSSSRPSSSSQKNQSFMEMITSANNDQEEDDDDEEVEFVVKKESSSNLKGNLSVKVETHQKPNTLRSKHSATEQRRRSKINDRFQKLREIIPNSDQKRDKASLLLEVIDYIQFLQEKVNRYESSHNVWNHEPSKMMQWKNSPLAEGFLDHTQVANTDSGLVSVFARKYGENIVGASSSLPVNGQNLVDSDMSTATTIKERSQPTELTSKAAQMQQNIFTFGRTCVTADSPASPEQKLTDTDKTMTWPQSAGEKSKDEKLTIESGFINISRVYSQGLLNTLTEALHKSGVDLSQASISVQIDLGKRAKSVEGVSTNSTKENDVPIVLPHPRAASAGEDIGRSTKRHRTC